KAVEVGTFMATDLLFYTCLTLTALLRAGPADVTRAAYVERLRRLRARLATWAELGPANYRHKHQFVAAAVAGLENDELGAQRLDDEAIEAARQHGFLRDEALGNELAARFYLAHGRTWIAHVYLSEAHYGYARWGAVTKVQELEAAYPQLLLGARAGDARGTL